MSEGVVELGKLAAKEQNLHKETLHLLRCRAGIFQLTLTRLLQEMQIHRWGQMISMQSSTLRTTTNV